MIHLNDGLAEVLGFHSNTAYPIYGGDFEKLNTISAISINDKCGVDYMYLHTDVIQPTNFGNQLVNILNCFTLDNGGNKGIQNTLYGDN